MTGNSHRNPHLLHVAVAWFQRTFSDPQAVVLVLLLLVGIGVIVIFGDMLAPVIASVVLAYLLEGLVRPLMRRGWPRDRAVLAVYALFLAFLALLVIGVTPLVWAQTVNWHVRSLPIWRGRRKPCAICPNVIPISPPSK